MSFDSFFWFSQPSSFLNIFDYITGWISVGLVGLALLLWLANKFFVKHEIVKKLLRKFINLCLTIGLIGLLWFGIRYENSPFLAKRFWIALVILSAVVWLLFIVKYLLANFRKEKAEYDRIKLNEKYMTSARR